MMSYALTFILFLFLGFIVGVISSRLGRRGRKFTFYVSAAKLREIEAMAAFENGDEEAGNLLLAAARDELDKAKMYL